MAPFLDDPNIANTASLKQLVEEKKVGFAQTELCESAVEQALMSIGRPQVAGVVDRVFVVLPQLQDELKSSIYNTCIRNRIPINTSDSPQWCTFTLLSAHTQGHFQMGVLTSGQGCKLALRIRRELVASLPSNIDQICSQVGSLRRQIQEIDSALDSVVVGEHDDDATNSSTLNKFIPEFDAPNVAELSKLRRARWLSQIVEYYPLAQLADVSLDDLSLQYKQVAQQQLQEHKEISSGRSNKASIALVGAGPGLLELLTVGALHAIYLADLILADKLVPQQVLDLIPRQRTELFIARKFPGNAERAQQELLEMGLAALHRGQRVVRLKQGDPYIFGRGGEEYLFFSQHGFIPRVLPGITSALAAPVLAQIPATHRDVADQVLVCTGTGRRGAVPNLPEYVESRTTVFLMALHRIGELVAALHETKGWSLQVPAAIIERGSCPDQRIIRTTLGRLAEAVEACGSRPPGLLVTGKACHVLASAPSADEPWIIQEGYNEDSRSVQQFINTAMKT